MNEDCVVSCCWSVFYPSQYVGRLCPLPEQTKLFRSPLWGRKSFRLRSVGKNLRRGIPARGGGTKKSNPGGLLVFYQRSSSETESFLRAWRRRALRTRRPLALAILARKPCLFTRLRREGWNVLFMISLFYYFSRKDCKGSNSGGKNKIIFQYVPPAFRRTRRPGARRRRARCARSRAGACGGPSRWQFPR